MTTADTNWRIQYEIDVEKQTRSGPHEITPEQRLANREVATALEAAGVMPIPDIHKLNDCDLIYRFLIAKKWDTKASADAIRAYAAWRKEQRIDSILWEEFPEDTKALSCVYMGFDREGHPVYFDKPDPKVLGKILVEHPKELLMRVHLQSMELGRRLQKLYDVDRVTCIIDFSMMSMSMVANPSAMRFMKELAHEDQTMYPENMRFMLICNGGWTFSSAYKVIKPVLDPRVQVKINFMGGKDALYSDLDKFVEKANLPADLKGTLPSEPLLSVEEVRRTDAVGSAPLPLASPLRAVAHKNPDDFRIDNSGITVASPTGALGGEEPPTGDDGIDDEDL